MAFSHIWENLDDKTPNQIEVPMFLFNKLYPILDDKTKEDVQTVIESFLTLSDCIQMNNEFLWSQILQNYSQYGHYFTTSKSHLEKALTHFIQYGINSNYPWLASLST